MIERFQYKQKPGLAELTTQLCSTLSIAMVFTFPGKNEVVEVVSHVAILLSIYVCNVSILLNCELFPQQIVKYLCKKAGP